LREPITLQRALVEITLADPDAEVAARRATGERVIAACEWQERMIDALLTLAHNDHGLTRSDEPIDLAASGAERTALGNLPHLVLPTRLAPSP
jgi:hypothetical protein